MRPSASSLCGLELLVYAALKLPVCEAFSYKCMRLEAIVYTNTYIYIVGTGDG
jgi:hypothetical protein